MTDITVKEFSKTVGLPVNRLIDQLELAGVNKKNENDLISDEEKMQLLDYARNNQSKKKISNESVKDSSQKDLNITKDDAESQKNKTVTRRKKVFSKKNNKITEKLDLNKEDSLIENLSESHIDKNNIELQIFNVDASGSVADFSEYSLEMKRVKSKSKI